MAFSDDLNPTIEDIHNCRILTTEASEASPSISSGQSGQFSSFSSPDLPAAIRTAFVLGVRNNLHVMFWVCLKHQTVTFFVSGMFLVI